MRWQSAMQVHEQWRRVVAEFRVLDAEARSRVLGNGLRDPNHRRYVLLVLREDSSLATSSVVADLIGEVVGGGSDLDLVAPILRQLPGDLLVPVLDAAAAEPLDEPAWLTLERLLWIYATRGEVGAIRGLLRRFEDSGDSEIREIMLSYGEWMA